MLCFIEWGILVRVPDVPEFAIIEEKRVRNHRAYSGWEKVWGIVCDNGANLQAALEYLPQQLLDESPPCLGHTV